MAVSFVQQQTLVESENFNASALTLGAPPGDGHLLVAVVSINDYGGSTTAQPFGVRSIRQEGATWKRVADVAGLHADEASPNALCRCEVWAAYAVKGASVDVAITWIGGRSLRSVAVLEYSGTVPGQNVPADQVAEDHGTIASDEGNPVTGDVDTGDSLGDTRVSGLWVAGVATTSTMSSTAPGNGFAVRTAISRLLVYDRLAGAAGGPVELGDTLSGSPAADVEWAAVACAFFDSSQAPVAFPEPEVPSVEVEENTDHASSCIRRLINLFRARS